MNALAPVPGLDERCNGILPVLVNPQNNHMRRLLPLLLLFALTACDKPVVDPVEACDLQAAYAANQGKVTITAGVWGTVSQMSGNCMPIVGPGSTCRHCAVQRTVRFYEYTLRSQATAAPNTSGFYSSFNTQLVREVPADPLGFYQANLPPGTYTMVIVENGLLYANGIDASNGINPVTVTSGLTQRNFISTYQAVF